MKLKIVVIDDEESIRDTFKWLLEDLGHEVITCAEPVTCEVYSRDSCQQDTPCSDTLIIDYHMPGMNGLEFIESLVQHGCHGKTENVLLMSGDTTKIDMQKVEKLGCRVAQKPISLVFLEEWVEEIQSRKKAAGISE